METKNVLQSKTFWTNAIIAVVYPFLPDHFKNPDYLTYGFIVLNLALRAISKGKIELK